MKVSDDEWTPEAAAAINLCKGWAKNLRSVFPCEVYLFGSAIYQAGDQFDAQLSDLDVVVVFTEELDVTQRVNRLQRLRESKAFLELHLIPTLHRSNCEEPGVSVLPVSPLEIRANIHKSGARRFYDKNIFYDLSSEKQLVGLPNAGTGIFPDEVRQALEFSQSTRNRFLAVSANATGGLPHFDGADPLPKALARVAAQLVPNVGEGEWYDTRLGLEFLCGELEKKRSESDQLEALCRKISVRRGGKGRRKPLTDLDQLLLVEILHDVAIAAPLEPVATWEIRFGGVTPKGLELDRLLADLRRLVPDGQVLGVFPGSIIIRMRSSKTSYLTVYHLYSLQVLPRFFDVETVDVSHAGVAREFSGFSEQRPIERVAAHIAEWRPRSTDSPRIREEKLLSWLEEWLRDGLPSGVLTREVLVGDGDRRFRADILLRFGEADLSSPLVIELTSFRSRSGFFHNLERILQLAIPAILVVVGYPQQFASLRGDIERLADLNSQVKIVTVPLDDG